MRKLTTIRAKVKPLVRKMIATKPGTAGHQQQAEENYRRRLIVDNPEYKQIIKALREGATPMAIAAHFAQNGWIDVHEKVFYKALLEFRKKNPDVLRNDDEETTNKLDELVSPKLPPLDVRGSLMQLVRVQKERIGIGLSFEKGANLITQHLHKDVQVAKELLETIAKVDGKIGESGTKAALTSGFAPDVAEDLGKLRKETANFDQMHSLVRQAVKQNANSD